jgi:NAD(P)-dependent dehydrogenase (short-subunit alcohol dehydrogenase family)
VNNIPRTVLITGADGNLGRAVAQAFAALGDRLLLVGLHREKLEAVLGKESERQSLIAVNLTNREATQAALAGASGFGPIHVLCHLAGGFSMGEAVHEAPEASWNHLYDLNVRTLVNVAAAVVPQMIANGGGKIVAIGASTALKGLANMGPYIATKSSVIRLTESMSAELRGNNINVNCVLPSVIDTPENRAAMPKADPAKWVSPQELANVIVFLASDAARAIHGASLPVTGLS